MESGGGRDIQINNTVQALAQSLAQGLNCSVTDVSGSSYELQEAAAHEYLSTGWMSTQCVCFRYRENLQLPQVTQLVQLTTSQGWRFGILQL
jgi:hypothetical protein